MNQYIATTGIDNFKEVLSRYDLSEFKCIYISLGSKYNERRIEYSIPNQQSVTKMSNATWQMIPGFTRYKKTLSICIDRFENEDIKEENKRMILPLLEDNIHFIVCDIDGTIQLFESIITLIIERVCIFSISPENIIIVNYLRFISPNHTENYLEEKLSPSIQKLLSKTDYSNCFYEWFGYQPNLYNIIYRYNNRIIYNILSSVCKILQKKIRNDELSAININVLFGESINTQFLEIFLKNTYDISDLHDTMKSFYNTIF